MTNEYMQAAIAEAINGVELGHGGPFGAVVVRDGVIIGRGHNQVVAGPDPTAHAEVLAIRHACTEISRFDLHGCELYTTCEPCPMCYAAAWWARISTIHYGCNRHDAAQFGFDDAAIYDDLEGRTPKQIRMVTSAREACLGPMRLWRERPDRVPY